jgi:hypothetical protein
MIHIGPITVGLVHLVITMAAAGITDGEVTTIIGIAPTTDGILTVPSDTEVDMEWVMAEVTGTITDIQVLSL